MHRQAQVYVPQQAPENLFIRQIWSIKDLCLQAREEQILPKGTAEIIFNLTEGIRVSQTGAPESSLLPVCFVNGLNQAPYRLLVGSKQHFVGVQLHVFALRYLFRMPTAEFTNQILEASQLCPLLNGLAAELASCASFQLQTQAVLRWFRKKIAAAQADPRILQLNADAGLLSESIPSLATKYNLTPRHLSRICQEYFGQTTEETLLYRKYLAALQQVHHTAASLTYITFACGFYDQPHFARTFKQFTGISARQYRKVKSELPGHLFHFPSE